MIRLVEIEVRGTSDAGPFRGALELVPGLQVISARNAYGKSLAARAVAWCLGLEPLLGVQDNDPSCLPLAAREEADFTGRPARIVSSECSITLLHDDGRELRLSRDILGERTVVRVEEHNADGSARNSMLQARRETMHDAHGGLQRFLFEWLRWPRAAVPTFQGGESEVYLENLAPLFYVEQNDGWTGIQARQIRRYSQLQISQIAVEYLLGATSAVSNRLARQQFSHVSATLRERARAIAEQTTNLLARRGWSVVWSGNGSLDEIVARWSARTLRDALKAQAEVDLSSMRASLIKRVDALRRTLTTEFIDPANVSAHTASSQRVIALKQHRHELGDALRTLRLQSREAIELLESLDHRIQSASDLLRLKTTGVGRLDEVECPTCHRELDPTTFSLTTQSGEDVAAHIKALKRDRDLIDKNVQNIGVQLDALRAEAIRVDADFRDAERALVTVTAAVGTVREQIAQTASSLTAAERELDRLEDTAEELDVLQQQVTQWIGDARQVRPPREDDADLERRLSVFTAALRQYLVALGHSAVNAQNSESVRLDAQYDPYLGARRLQLLGSASDGPRLVAAFSLALAAASRQVGGLHPGLVILDEPLQQNPDDPHRDLFSSFLTEELALRAGFQVVILTSLRDAEVASLREKGTAVLSPDSEHFLRLDPPPPARVDADEATSNAESSEIAPAIPETRVEPGPEPEARQTGKNHRLNPPIEMLKDNDLCEESDDVKRRE